MTRTRDAALARNEVNLVVLPPAEMVSALAGKSIAGFIVAEPFNAAAPHEDLELWPVWEKVKCPTLVIRGGLSDLLMRDTVERMKTTGPHAEAVELRGIGHAPTLMHADQIAIVRDYLLRG